MAGRDFHAPLLRAVDGLQLTHVVTGNPERAVAARSENPGVTVLPSTDELWWKADEVDLVVLASPTNVHAEQATRSLGRDLPTVVDKPLATSAAEARDLAALAASRGVLLTVFHNRRWDPEHLTARAVLASGVLGEVVRYEARYERWRPVPKDALARAVDQHRGRRRADGPAVAPRRQRAGPVRPGRSRCTPSWRR